MNKSLCSSCGDAPGDVAQHGAALAADAGITGLPGERHRSSGFQLASTPVRQSSARRMANLHALIAELKVRNMGYGAVALFLACSSSAARNYMHELRDAGVIASALIRQSAGCIDKMAFYLNPDPALAQNYLATLDASKRGNKIVTKGGEHQVDARANVRHFHIVRDDARIALAVGSTSAQRDPLVAALFGART